MKENIDIFNELKEEKLDIKNQNEFYVPENWNKKDFINNNKLNIRSMSEFEINDVKHINEINGENNNESYNISNNYFKKYNSKNNNRFNNLFDNINPKKEIIYNFGYKKQDRLEPLKLNLADDSIKIQENADEIPKLKKEKLANKFEELQLHNSEKKINKNIISKNYINTKKNMHTPTNNYKWLSKIVERELNLTKSQMNILDKDANKLYIKYKNNIKDNNALLKRNINSINNIFLCKQATNDIKKNKDLNAGFTSLKNNKLLITPLPLLMPSKNENKRSINLYKYNKNKKDIFFSPKQQKRIAFFLNI